MTKLLIVIGIGLGLVCPLVACGDSSPPSGDAGDSAGDAGDSAQLVGERCVVGVDPIESPVIASPALECPGQLCLAIPLEVPPEDLPPGSEHAPLCTDECQRDDQCASAPESLCKTGFTCGAAISVGPFACTKVCVCRDYLEDGELTVPAACEP